MEIRWSDARALTQQQINRLDELASQAVTAPFGDREAFDAWVHTLPTDRVARCCELSDGGRIIAMLVLSANATRPGTPDPVNWQLWGETIDFGVVWAEPARAGECWALWFEALRAQDIGLVRLRNVRMADPVISAMVATARTAGVTLDLLDRRLAPYVDLQHGFDAWLAGRSKSQRRQYRRAMRSFASVPNLELQFLRSPAAVRAAMTDFFELHQARRAALDKGSVYDRPQAAQFLDALAEPWAARGRLGVLLARSGQTAIGVELIVVTDHTWYSLNGGWRHEFAPYHVGTGLLLEAMQRAAFAGVTRYSLLEGEEPYKMRMASAGHQLVSWDVHLSATS